ncbi:hypothetical protein SAMN04487906_2509 [Zhouia amylolytica]|uniref:Uncharacterized protein n=2 Tax=Zhouia amylolytica TaxID=376730 RepID=W2UQ23_9FLAO|nr:hypothetical protein [Zhouia amylolytica]ETN95412.1 hypothetical protein P278_11340 [Zhouia amylolytica AD3]SFT01435.1 hypothetical protein SAMN04487906_2509 [Zhouia amylolytica]
MRQRLIKHIVLFAFSFALSGILFFPTILSVAHSLLEHNHFECYDFDSTHFHKKDVECEIFKFKSNYYVDLIPKVFELEDLVLPTVNTFNYYSYLSEYQALHFYLRGPPSFVHNSRA